MTAGDENAIKVCYVALKPVFDEYAQDLRARGQSPRLDLEDLRRELASEPYCLPLPNGGDRVHRWEICGSKHTCCVVSLEKNSSGKCVFAFGEELEAILKGSGEAVE